MEKGFELRPYDRGGTLVAAFVLSLFGADKATQERNGKRNTVYACGARGFEVIFTLLIKVVAIYVGFTLIDLRDPSF